MAFEELHWITRAAIYKIENNMWFLIILHLVIKKYHVECHRDPFQDTTVFFIYVNDLDKVPTILFPIPFADDTRVFVNGKDIDALMVIMNKDVENGILVIS